MDDTGRTDVAFREQAVACLTGLFSYAMALSRNRAVAEDLVQETYVRALAARRRAEPDQNLRGWLFTILHNVWLNQVRGRRLLPIDETSRPAGVVWLKPALDPEGELERGRLREALRRAIAALPDGYRETVVLRFIEGFSYQEIASIMGCPIGTVMSRLARGRALLRRVLTLAPPRSREAG